jgi:hypothetical protein
VSDYVDVAVPFIVFGNRRGLTDMQMQQQPWVREFFSRFRHCFEYDPYRDVYLFIEEGNDDRQRVSVRD